jgi:hypothetical protein
MEAPKQSRQQLFENTAKFNRTQPLPALRKPQRVQSLSVSHNCKNDAGSILFSTPKFIPPADEINTAVTSSSTTRRSSAFASDKFHVANASSLDQQKSRPTTPISKLIQQFTSEILSPKPQSQSSVKESLKFKPTDDTHTSWRSTAASSTVLPSEFQSSTVVHNTIKPAATAIPFKSLNMVKPSKTSVQQSNTESNGVTLRRPSYFWRRTNSAEPILQCSLITETGTVTSKRAVSLQMPQTFITDSVVRGAINHIPEVATKVQTTEAVPFRPPEWVKLPATSVDQTDSGPSRIRISSNSSVKMAGRSSQPSSVAQQHLTRASSFHSYPVTERSMSCVSPTSSERITGQSIQLNKAPGITSPYETTNTRIFVSKWESPNKPKHSNSNFHSCGQVVQCSSSSSLTSFSCPSKTASIPVKSLVKKFSRND